MRAATPRPQRAAVLYSHNRTINQGTRPGGNEGKKEIMKTDKYQVLTDYKGYDVVFSAQINAGNDTLERWQIFNHETTKEVMHFHWFTELQEVIDWINR